MQAYIYVIRFFLQTNERTEVPYGPKKALTDLKAHHFFDIDFKVVGLNWQFCVSSLPFRSNILQIM